MKFALLTKDFVFFTTATGQLADSRGHFTLSADGIALLNPNTHTCPVFRSQMDAELTKKIYDKVPILTDEALGEDGNPWDISFRQGLVNMASDSYLFFDESAADRLPLYEAKLIHHYGHRWATYTADGFSRDVALTEKQDPVFESHRVTEWHSAGCVIGPRPRVNIASG